MGQRKLRDNNKCLNCGTTVADRYCPACGQENRETRMRFPEMLQHFLSHFFSFDGKIGITLKALVAHPGKLSADYTEGKRNRYVNPLTLYVFANILTFLVFSTLTSSITISVDNGDFLEEYLLKENTPMGTEQLEKGFSTEQVRMLIDEYRNDRSVIERFLYKTEDYLPKVLVVYLPLFAFWLWWLNRRARPYYYDSGIFTLHFFSFGLLALVAVKLVSFALKIWLPAHGYTDYISRGLFGVCLSIVLIYFILAYRRFYPDKKGTAALKITTLVLINGLLFSASLLLYFYLLSRFYLTGNLVGA